MLPYWLDISRKRFLREVCDRAAATKRDPTTVVSVTAAVLNGAKCQHLLPPALSPIPVTKAFAATRHSLLFVQQPPLAITSSGSAAAPRPDAGDYHLKPSTRDLDVIAETCALDRHPRSPSLRLPPLPPPKAQTAFVCLFEFQILGMLQLPDDIEWHFIGNLQRNKVKHLMSWIQLIEGESDVAAKLKTATGKVYVARSSCWFMLKDGFVANASGPSQLHFEWHNVRDNGDAVRFCDAMLGRR
nr:Glyco_hydro_10 domain-containing protein/CBM_4_9 domain-containing protein [Ipomoea batatas]